MNTEPLVWIEVDLSAIRRNLREIRSVVGARVSILAVVKADAYGHGAVEVSRALADEGVACLGVTRLEDAVALREASISAPVLVFSPCLPRDSGAVIEYDLDQTVCSTALARSLSEAAAAQGKIGRVHIKVDTGLGRLGVSIHEAVDYARAISGLPSIEIAGVYTHFATAAEKDERGLLRQYEAFNRVLRHLRSAQVAFGSAHAAASAAILRLPGSHFDMVRPGTLLYGQYPSTHVPRLLGLSNTWTMKTRVVAVRTLAGGEAIGYGSEYRTTRRTVIAVLPVGYADGLTMLPESVAHRNAAKKLVRRAFSRGEGPRAVIRERSVPIVGRVAMEMCVADVTDIPGVEIGDEVTLSCRRIASTSRIPRIYTP